MVMNFLCYLVDHSIGEMTGVKVVDSRRWMLEVWKVQELSTGVVWHISRLFRDVKVVSVVSKSELLVHVNTVTVSHAECDLRLSQDSEFEH